MCFMPKRQLNCWIDADTFEALEIRAKALNMKPSRYATVILQNWAEHQAPQLLIEQENHALKQQVADGGNQE